MEGEDMKLVSIESDEAQYKPKPQEIERAQTQPEEYLNDFVSSPILPFQLCNLTSIFPIGKTLSFDLLVFLKMLFF